LPGQEDAAFPCDLRLASPGYFEALGIPLKRGRWFTDGDGRTGGRVVVLSEMLARKIWPDQDPIGRQIKWGVDGSRAPWMTVVGVVGDVKQGALGTETLPQTYEPIVQQPDAVETLDFYRRVSMVTRSGRDASAVLGDLRSALQRLDPALPVSDAQTVADVVSDSVKPQRFGMTVVGLFAIVALGLAAIGIYGVLANAVSQRTHEIGIRMALGAETGDVLRIVLRQGLQLAALGVSIGVGAAFGLTRVMSSLLFGVSTTDPIIFASISIILTGVSLGATFIPARLAAKVDSMIALRYE
jgi:predicted permease